MKVRKKPVVVDAEVYDGTCQHSQFPRGMCQGLWNECGYKRAEDWKPHIHTLEGRMDVAPGDWIIRGVKGEYYPCKPDIFAMTYEFVDK